MKLLNIMLIGLAMSIGLLTSFIFYTTNNIYYNLNQLQKETYMYNRLLKETTNENNDFFKNFILNHKHMYSNGRAYLPNGRP